MTEFGSSNTENEPESHLDLVEFDNRLGPIIDHEKKLSHGDLHKAQIGRRLLAGSFAYHAPSPELLPTVYKGWGKNEVEEYLSWVNQKAEQYDFAPPTKSEADLVLSQVIWVAEQEGVLAFAEHYQIEAEQIRACFWQTLEKFLGTNRLGSGRSINDAAIPEIRERYHELGLGELPLHNERLAHYICDWVRSIMSRTKLFSSMIIKTTGEQPSFNEATIVAARCIRDSLAAWGYTDPLEVPRAACYDPDKVLNWIYLQQCWAENP